MSTKGYKVLGTHKSQFNSMPECKSFQSESLEDSSRLVLLLCSTVTTSLQVSKELSVVSLHMYVCGLERRRSFELANDNSYEPIIISVDSNPLDNVSDCE